MLLNSFSLERQTFWLSGYGDRSEVINHVVKHPAFLDVLLQHRHAILHQYLVRVQEGSASITQNTPMHHTEKNSKSPKALKGGNSKNNIHDDTTTIIMERIIKDPNFTLATTCCYLNWKYKLLIETTNSSDQWGSKMGLGRGLFSLSGAFVLHFSLSFQLPPLIPGIKV